MTGIRGVSLGILLFVFSCKEGSSEAPKKKPTKTPNAGDVDSGGGPATNGGNGGVASGPLTVGSSTQIGNESFTVLSTTNLTSSGGYLTGSGSVVAQVQSTAVKSDNHFSVRATLAEGASLRVHTFSTAALQKGVDVVFQVTGKKLRLTVGGKDFSSKVSTVNALGELDIGVDLHNAEANPHVLVWVNATAKTEDSAKVNSEKDGLNLARGTGTSWGMTLLNAKVSNAGMDAPAFSEDE